MKELYQKYKLELACLVYIALRVLNGQDILPESTFNALVDGLVAATGFTGIVLKKEKG